MTYTEKNNAPRRDSLYQYLEMDLEQHCNQLFNASIDMLCVLDFEGYVININPAWEMVLGYPITDLLSKSLIDFVHLDDREKVKLVAKRCNMGITIRELEARFRCKDGSYKWLSWNCVPLVEEGTIHSTARDITERKMMEDRLKLSEERYRLFVESSPDGIIMVAGDKVKFANLAMAKLVKVERSEDLIGRSIYEFVAEVESLRLKEIKENIIEKNDLSLMELKLLATNGDLVDIELSPISLPSDNGISIVCMIRDIGDRKKNEELQRYIIEKEKSLKEALEYDRLRTEFFSNISHEFKTPLNVILGTLQLVSLYMKDKKAKAFEKKIVKKINTMKQNCYRLLRLVNNLIDINRIDAGYYEINLENHDIVKIIRDISLSVKEYVEDKGICFEFLTETPEMVIACDPYKIERIILNLLSNAIKHTGPQGLISVNIKNDAEKIYISIKDTGTGIPKEKLDVIFERFSQVDESLIKKNEGSGIGLSLVKSLTEMHGGNVLVESEVGEGTEFNLHLPIIQLPSKTTRVFEEIGTYFHEKQIEKISIEFSDIYFEKSIKIE